MIRSKTDYNRLHNLVFLNEKISTDHFWRAKAHHYSSCTINYLSSHLYVNTININFWDLTVICEHM